MTTFALYSTLHKRYLLTLSLVPYLSLRPLQEWQQMSYNRCSKSIITLQLLQIVGENTSFLIHHQNAGGATQYWLHKPEIAVDMSEAKNLKHGYIFEIIHSVLDFKGTVNVNTKLSKLSRLNASAIVMYKPQCDNRFDMPEYFFENARRLQHYSEVPASASWDSRHFWYNLFTASYMFTDTDYEVFEEVLYNLCWLLSHKRDLNVWSYFKIYDVTQMASLLPLGKTVQKLESLFTFLFQ